MTDTLEVAFTRLYETHYRAILAYLICRVGSTATAQDLAEDVFLTAWRKIDQIPDEPADIYWLYGVARRVLANHNRKIWRRSRISQQLRTPTLNERLPEDVVVRRESDEIVFIALKRLRARDRELIMLAYWDELPHSEIADLLGASRGTVDVRLHRAMGRLRKELARSGQVQAEGFPTRTPKEFEC